MTNPKHYIIPALKTAVIYAVFGGLWILLSDKLLGFLVTDLDTYASIQTYKGWAYIIITAFLVFHLVATYLRQAVKFQDELKASEERYQLAMDGAEIGTWDWNIETNDVVFNDTYIRMLGYAPGSFPPIYMGWEALVHPDDKDHTLKALTEHLEGRSDDYETEFRMLTADKKWKWMLARGKVFRRDERGNPLRAVGIQIDLSDRKETEQELESAKETAESASLAMSQFLSNMSQQIRTPLDDLMASFQRIKQSELNAKQDEALTNAEASGRKLVSFMNDVLSLSEVEATVSNGCTIDLDLTLLTEIITRVFETQLSLSGVELVFNLDKDIPKDLCCDQDKLRQILFNLVGNTLKHTKGGKITVEVTALPDNRNPMNTLVIFTVNDSVTTVPQDRIDKAVTPYTQMSRSFAEEYDDQTLGFGIVSRLVPILGGSLCIDSNEEEGTLIIFTIVCQSNSN